jgi:hydrogenase maturation protease
MLPNGNQTVAPPRPGGPQSVLVIGLGNPILCDDGIGWRVAEEVKRRIVASGWPIKNGDPPSAFHPRPPAIEVDCFALGGLSLMERLIGYDRAIVLDAMTLGVAPGSVACFDLNALPNHSAAHLTAAHDTSLQNAMRLGRLMGARLPDRVTVVGIEAERVFEFGEELTPAVAAVVPSAARLVMDLLNEEA